MPNRYSFVRGQVNHCLSNKEAIDLSFGTELGREALNINLCQLQFLGTDLDGIHLLNKN